MKRLTFLRSVGVALVLSLAAAILITTLDTVFSTSWVMRFVISMVSLAYILYLLRMSNHHVGRMVLIAVLSVASLVMLYLQLTISLYALFHVAMICLVRSLYFHNSLFVSFADLGLSAFSFASSVWVLQHTSSLFLTFWCFFLVQALIFPLLSKVFNQAATTAESWLGSDAWSDNDQTFQKAYRNAELALRNTSFYQ